MYIANTKMEILYTQMQFLGVQKKKKKKKKRFHLTSMIRPFSFKWPKDQVFELKENYFPVKQYLFLVSKLGYE